MGIILVVSCPKVLQTKTKVGHKCFMVIQTKAYTGQIPSWVDETVICFNCNWHGHIKPNCPNARASIPYIPICGNCKQNGHTVEECNGPRKEGPQDNNNN
jgi:hypothetical protein